MRSSPTSQEQHEALAGRHAQEVDAGVRFGSGENWRSFLERPSEARIDEASRTIARLLGEEQLDGCTVLDAGSRSALSSLPALRLDAARVHSSDYDPASVA